VGFLAITLEQSDTGLRQYANHLKANGTTFRTLIVDTRVTGQNVEDFVVKILRPHRATAAPYIAALAAEPRLAEYMKAKAVDDKQDVVADFNTMLAAADACDVFISAVLEKNQDGKLGATFPESELPQLLANVEAILAATG
jgi:hypothetical protein